MISEQLILRGVGGLAEGETFRVDYGETVIVGRSSSCDISLKKCEKYLLLDQESKDSEKHFQTVSRKQVRISFYNATSIEIEDLSSSNGSFLDGEQIKKVIISDIKENSHELLLGTKEKFVLSWVPGGSREDEDLDEEGLEDEPILLGEDDLLDEDEAEGDDDIEEPDDFLDDDEFDDE